jgi:hypothetical protein
MSVMLVYVPVMNYYQKYGNKRSGNSNPAIIIRGILPVLAQW